MSTFTESEARAERAYRTLLVFDGGNESVEEDAIDLITNLLHMIDLQYGVEPEAALRSAWHHFMAERES